MKTMKIKESPKFTLKGGNIFTVFSISNMSGSGI